MSKTKIEWCDWTINPVKGLCPMACPYCYARRMYKWYQWDERLTYHMEVWGTLPKKPSRIFVGSTTMNRRRVLVIDTVRCNPKCGWQCKGCPYKKASDKGAR